MIQLAQNNGRFYKVSIRQMRYFPVKKVVALAMLGRSSTGRHSSQVFQNVPFRL